MEAQRRPGDLIIDHYLPNATSEERELARTRLRRLAEIIYQACDAEIDEELAADSHDARSDVKLL